MRIDGEFRDEHNEIEVQPINLWILTDSRQYFVCVCCRSPVNFVCHLAVRFIRFLYAPAPRPSCRPPQLLPTQPASPGAPVRRWKFRSVGSRLQPCHVKRPNQSLLVLRGVEGARCNDGFQAVASSTADARSSNVPSRHLSNQLPQLLTTQPDRPILYVSTPLT